MHLYAETAKNILYTVEPLLRENLRNTDTFLSQTVPLILRMQNFSHT